MVGPFDAPVIVLIPFALKKEGATNISLVLLVEISE